MSSSLTSPAAGGRADPARARGLRRSRAAAPCPAVAVVAVPRKPTAAEVLVLVSRVRQAQVDAGELHSSRLFDVRVYKTVDAELAYVHRLAHAKAPSAHVATSMPQLVKGLARLHPRWDMSGDKFQARDRHHSAVRRRLGVMAACGLLTWQAGVNLEGEESRTELLLLDPPPVTAEELKAARAQLARWRRQYGAGLNTGSMTGIRDVTKVAAAPSKAECETRARNRAQQRRAARIRMQGSQAKTAPPLGAAFAFGEQQNAGDPVDCVDKDPRNCASSSNAPDITNACGLTTGARRTRARSFNCSPGAVEGNRNSSIEGERPQLAAAPGGLDGDLGPVGARSGSELGEEVARRVTARLANPVFMQRLADEQAQADEIAVAIAAGAARRAGELAASGLGRSWPTGRIREAWFVARYGADAATGGAVSAFSLSVERERQLQRALARYQAHAAQAPEGWPRGAWAAFLHAAASWEHKWPAGTIEGLDQLTRRMRARGSADDLQRQAAARRRAEGRHTTSDTPGPLVFRPTPDAGGRWPAWTRLGSDGRPIVLPATKERGEWLQERLAVEEGHPFLPPAGDSFRVLVERDAFLLAGRPLPAHLDGRRLMADRDSGHAHPSGHDPQAARVDSEVLELARLQEGLTVAQVLRLSDQLRSDMLTAARARAARQQAAERHRFLHHLTHPDTP